MGFGLSFGAKKQSSTTNSTINKNEVSSQVGSESTNSQQSTTGSTNTSGTSSTQQNQQTTGATTNNTSGTTTQQTTGTQNSFSDATKGGLEDSIASLISGISGDQATVRNGANALSFDGNAYVQDAVRAAQASTDMELSQGINGLIDSLGGTGNTMGALLQQQMRNQAAASVAGVRAQAEQTAAGIEQNQVATQAGALGGLGSLAATIANALKGGNVSTTGTMTGTENQFQSGTSQQGTTGSSTTQEQQNQQTSQVTNLISLVNQLLNTNTATTATENSKTKGKSMGGGMSLSI